MNAYSNAPTAFVSEKYLVPFTTSSPLVGMSCHEFFLPLNSHLLSYSLTADFTSAWIFSYNYNILQYN